MRQCSEYIGLHENDLGKVGHCFGCESYHLRMNGLLSVINDNELDKIERSLEEMRVDLKSNQDIDDVEVGVQIKITNNMYLCLTYSEIVDGIELINMGRYMKNINDLML